MCLYILMERKFLQTVYICSDSHAICPNKAGATLNIIKKAPAKALIEKHSRDFRGKLNDGEAIKLTGLSRNTYYKIQERISDRAESVIIRVRFNKNECYFFDVIIRQLRFKYIIICIIFARMVFIMHVIALV